MKLFSPLLIVGLIAVNAALGFAAWELTSSPLAVSKVAPADQNANIDIDPAATGSDLQIIDVTSFSILTARPVFSPSRRQIIAVTKAPKKQISSTPVIIITPLKADLIGIAIDNKHKTALIKVQSEQRLRILELGDQIDNWRLVVIEDKRVVFKQKAEQTELLLRPKP